MTYHTTTCESCDSEIVRGGVPVDVTNAVITIPTDDSETFEERDYSLCAECRRQIVDFIEGLDETETRVDMVEMELAERELSEAADDLFDLSTKLGALARGEVSDAEDEDA